MDEGRDGRSTGAARCVLAALLLAACEGTETPTNPGTGGVNPSGGSPSSGGVVNTGGAPTGGSTVGGRSAGICPGGTYPTPSLSGTPTLVSSTTGSGFYEGPVWVSSQGVLLFSNLTTDNNPIDPSEIRRLSPPTTANVFVADSGTNGLALDLDGTVLGCSHKVQGIIRVDPTSGAMTTLLNTDSSGKHFNSPNDLTVRSDGTIYFTDPDYQLGSSRTSETGIKGVYRVTPSRQVILVDGTFGEPNGVALSPDETVLYVSDFSANAIRRFTVAADGSTSGRQNFATVTSPDGVAVDCAGNLYWASNTSAGAVRVFTPSGTQLGTISVPSGVSNVAFGGSDHKTLYITAGRGLYSLALNVPGFPY